MNYLKLIISLLLILTINIENIFSQQVINGGFEDTNEFNTDTYWALHSSLAVGCIDPPFPDTGNITNEANNGLNAIYLKPDYCYPSGVIIPGAVYTHFGFNPSFGYEYHERPEFLNFYYKYYPNVSGETAFVKIMLFDYNSSTYEVTEVIGEASANMTEVNQYTFFTLPIEYYTSSTPDYIHILFSTSENFSYWENQPAYNHSVDNVNSLETELLIDDVFVSGGGIGTDDYLFNPNIRVYPNPVLDFLTIQTDILCINSIKILDVLGNLIKVKNNDFSSIQLSNFNKGLYFLEIETNRGMMTKKIIKK